MLSFEVTTSETRGGYIWRIRNGIIIGISLATYPTHAEAFEDGQVAMFSYFFAEERRLAKS